MRLPSSARARRRLLYTGIAAVLALAGVLVAVLVPGHAPSSPGPRVGAPQAADLAVAAPKVKLTPTDRREIDAVLDRFLPAAMERKDAALAWQLAGPELKSGSTLAAWRKGDSPVPYYLASEHTFHHWQKIDVGPGYLIFNLLVHPQKGFNLASTVFSGEVVKERGKWLVNRLYTIAIMNRVTKTTHEIGPADFAAPPPSNSSGGSGSRLGKIGIVPAVSIFAAILLIPLALGLVALRRARRWKRQVSESGRREMPTLPARYRTR